MAVVYEANKVYSIPVTVSKLNDVAMVRAEVHWEPSLTYSLGTFTIKKGNGKLLALETRYHVRLPGEPIVRNMVITGIVPLHDSYSLNDHPPYAEFRVKEVAPIVKEPTLGEQYAQAEQFTKVIVAISKALNLSLDIDDPAAKFIITEYDEAATTLLRDRHLRL